MNYQLIVHGYIICFRRFIIQLEDQTNFGQELDRLSYRTVFNKNCQESWGLSSSKEKDKVNCEDAETIGANIKTKLGNKPFNNISFKRSNCVITLVALQKSVKCKYEVVHFDLLRLFTRLLSIAERTNKFKEYFKY